MAIAALVAWCNALSSARLAALYPQSGGAYVYGRERLGPLWGFIAGWGFIVGKLASCAAMALTFGSYAAPELARPLAVGAVVVLTAVDYFGVHKTALATRIIVVVVLAVLATVVAAVWLGGAADASRVLPLHAPSLGGVLESAGLLFFAFAGYARIATLGEEVKDPARTLPRAIPIALGITLFVYAAVALSAVAGAGADALAQSSTPLVTAIEGGTLRALAPLVRVGAAVAALGVLLSLIVGVSRTTFAMAANHDLPKTLAVVHPRHHIPHRAELAVGAIVAIVAALVDLRGAIGFSSFAVLGYYAITNAAAFTLGAGRTRVVAVMGLGGCVTLAATLPLASVLGGSIVLATGALVFALTRRPARPVART